jgi:hypothetical protein
VGKAPAAAAPATAAPKPVAPPLTPEQRSAQQAEAAQKIQQKTAECRQQAAKDHPEGSVEYMKEYIACLRGQ